MKTFKKIIPFIAAALTVVSLTACGAVHYNKNTASETDTPVSTEQTKAFPKFQGTDFEGNAVDESLFSQNTVTVLNFWFNGCSACVDEMPGLEDLNKALREKGAELVGVNVVAGDDDKTLREAKEILEKQSATYRNIYVKEGKEITEFLNSIYGFPTTVLVDKNGNIICDPILGTIDDEARTKEILKMVDEAAAGRTVSSSDTEETGSDDVGALIEEENAVFLEHIDTWGKVFDLLPEGKAAELSPLEFVELLKEQINTMKDSLTEDELNTLNDDMQKIEAIEQKISALEDAE